MTKENLEILEFEDKKTNAGKRYARFKTSDGWMSCFDKKSIEELKEHEGKTARCEISEQNGFKNIRKFLGKDDDEEEEKKPAKKEVRVESKPAFNQASMYVSYAKDLFLGIMGKKENTPEPEIMKLCIDLVLQAKDAFENKPQTKVKKEIPEEELPDY
jgi:hypothetical protein